MGEEKRKYRAGRSESARVKLEGRAREAGKGEREREPQRAWKGKADQESPRLIPLLQEPGEGEGERSGGVMEEGLTGRQATERTKNESARDEEGEVQSQERGRADKQRSAREKPGVGGSGEARVAARVRRSRGSTRSVGECAA